MKGFTQSQPLYKQAYDSIKEAILKGEIKPGSKISVTKLSEQFNVSRTPLREALRQLTKDGLLLQDHLSTTVVSLNQADHDELLDCRLVLEKEIIRLIVPLITDRQLEEAENYLKHASVALESDEKMKLLECNSKFHEVLIHACPNKRLVQLLERVRSLLLLYRANIVFHHYFHASLEHQEILEAIRARDIDQAVIKVEEHLLQDRQRGKEVFDMLAE